MRLLVIAVAAIIAGCSAVSAGGSASPDTDPVPALVDLLTQAGGADVRRGESFDGTPLSTGATTICVGTEALQVYTFDTNSARDGALATMDRDDPSHIGTAIVEWLGTPRFWTADRAIVLYAGDAATVVKLVSSVLGQPFAAGHGMAGGPIPRNCS